MVQGNGVIALSKAKSLRVVQGREAKLNAGFTIGNARPYARLEVLPCADIGVGSREVVIEAFNLGQGHVNGTIHGYPGILEMDRNRNQQGVIARRAEHLSIAHRLQAKLMGFCISGHPHHVRMDRVCPTGPLCRKASEP